jgi:hypothetical protein
VNYEFMNYVCVMDFCRKCVTNGHFFFLNDRLRPVCYVGRLSGRCFNNRTVLIVDTLNVYKFL